MLLWDFDTWLGKDLSIFMKMYSVNKKQKILIYTATSSTYEALEQAHIHQCCIDGVPNNANIV